jgi:hypothetical protein
VYGRKQCCLVITHYIDIIINREIGNLSLGKAASPRSKRRRIFQNNIRQWVVMDIVRKWCKQQYCKFGCHPKTVSNNCNSREWTKKFMIGNHWPWSLVVNWGNGAAKPSKDSLSAPPTTQRHLAQATPHTCFLSKHAACVNTLNKPLHNPNNILSKFFYFIKNFMI